MSDVKAILIYGWNKTLSTILTRASLIIVSVVVKIFLNFGFRKQNFLAFLLSQMSTKFASCYYIRFVLYFNEIHGFIT